jgi:predicted SAM-dependent methyltransferase
LNPLPIEDEMVAHVNAEHFLEHLEYSDAITFLGECYRLLKIAGTMRIVVPDVEKYMYAYVTNDLTFFDQLKNVGGTREPLPTKDAICNQMFRMDGSHRFAWDFETLEHVLRQIGFSTIRQSHHNDSSSPYRIDGQDWWRPVESLYVNIIKESLAHGPAR